MRWLDRLDPNWRCPANLVSTGITAVFAAAFIVWALT